MESESAWEVTKALLAIIWDDRLWKGVLSSIEGLGGSCACSCIAFIAAWIRWRTTSNRLVREINISRRFDLLSESGLQLPFDSRIAIFIHWRTISILAFRRELIFNVVALGDRFGSWFNSLWKTCDRPTRRRYFSRIRFRVRFRSNIRIFLVVFVIVVIGLDIVGIVKTLKRSRMRWYGSFESWEFGWYGRFEG